MLTLQETIAINNLEHAINNAIDVVCSCNGGDCTACPFRYYIGNEVYSCIIRRMNELFSDIRDNVEEEQ